MLEPSSSGDGYYLFVKNPLQGILQNLLLAATGKVEDMEAAALMSPSDDPGAVAREIVAEWPFKMPILDEAGIYTTHEEIRGEVKDVPRGHRRDVPLQRYVFHIPFSGNASVFHIKPKMTLSTPLVAQVSGSEVQVEFREETPNADAMKATFERTLSHIKSYLGWIEADLETGLPSIISSVTSTVQTRRARIKQASGVAASLGYPLRKRDDSARVAVPIKRKLIQVNEARSPTQGSPAAPEPYLENSAYEAILDVIASMSLLIERNPSTFARIPEEVLRDHFLLQLNGQFQGRAIGETFNANGKTDILLRDGDRNVFIAECKYWTGPKSLTDAIDQLLKYLTWRDSKAVVLVFNRNKDFTRVIGEAENALKSHSQYGSKIATTRATGLRARMTHPDDKERHIDLIVCRISRFGPGRFPRIGPTVSELPAEP
jgi:hypothetical protein